MESNFLNLQQMGNQSESDNEINSSDSEKNSENFDESKSEKDKNISEKSDDNAPRLSYD